MSSPSRRWVAALSVPVVLAALCAVAYVALELAGASCSPDKIGGDCNVAADVQLGVLFGGALAASAAVAVAVIYVLVSLVRRGRTRGGQDAR